MRRRLINLFIIIAVCGNAAAQRQPTLTGDVWVRQNFHSKILNNARDIIVYLPPGYGANLSTRYSVFYFHDGQNIFDGATSYLPGQEWRIDETAQSLIEAGKIEPLIIVGIYNTGTNRVHEYTPAEDPKYKSGGKADLYGRMIVEELMPFIDARYRTRKGAHHTGLGGSSLGGLVTVYLGMKYPKVFGRLAVVSPSVWWADNQIVRFTEALPEKPPLRIWLDMGTREGPNESEAQNTLNGARLLRDTLIKKGWKLEKDLRYFEAAGAEHNERAWAARVGFMLQFLFPKE